MGGFLPCIKRQLGGGLRGSESDQRAVMSFKEGEKKKSPSIKMLHSKKKRSGFSETTTQRKLACAGVGGGGEVGS